ncbi:hypothetical protein B566_EDAN008201 [Ephemera danica]|nr:hypothetical protein B566_EDAN008201 [Ephemera danica]
MNYTSRTMSHAIKRFGVRWLSNSCIDISPEISAALHDGHPVVALESAIITHGMPQPHNLDTALKVQQIVRDKGAVPATIAILNGRVKVGLTDMQLEQLAIGEKLMAMKTSRRDFPQVIAMKKHGGTTVAGTMLVARSVGIRVFATGGLGGVHRGAEDSWDVSADLVELGRTPVAVVCSGAKAILDIPRTLEFLETQGVCVSTVGPQRDFPAFYWRSSGCFSPCHSSTIEEAAQLASAWWKVASTSGSGLVLAVPVPEEAAVSNEGMEEAIRAAVTEAETQNVRGRDLTPFLLTRVNQLTEGTALKTTTAAQICKRMHELEVKQVPNVNSPKSMDQKTDNESSEGGVVIVGGCALDRVVKLDKTDIEVS